MSLTTSLQAGLKGILAQQRQSEITGNNISNVNTPGYSRQTAGLSPSPTINIGGLMLGQGVDVDSVNREYDMFVSGQLAEQSSVVGDESARTQPLAELERIMSTGDDSLATEIDEFFGSWHELAENPGGGVEREQVLYKGQNLLDKFEQVRSGLVDVSGNIDETLNAEVETINQKLREFADLNGSIKQKETLGHEANSDRDRRDLLVKELSGTLGVETFETGDGQIGMQLPGGQSLVQGENASRFGAEYVDGKLSFSVKSNDVERQVGKNSFGGEFRGLLDIRDDTIPGLRKDIDQLEHKIVTEVNAQHEQGYGLDGENGRSFFTRQPSYLSETGFDDADSQDFGGGTIELNGVEVEITEGENNSLNGIRDAINDADAGVKASVVKDSESDSYHLNLTPETKGEDVDFKSRLDLDGGDPESAFEKDGDDSVRMNSVGSDNIGVALSSTDEVAAAGQPAGSPGDN
ncbi:MAG: flagellar hook-associated protein FlgK, partial [Desulfosalsimonas sp.]